MKIQDVPRNNIGAALKFYEENKPISADIYRTLMKLQDDPEDLMRKLRNVEIEIEDDWRNIV